MKPRPLAISISGALCLAVTLTGCGAKGGKGGPSDQGQPTVGVMPVAAGPFTLTTELPGRTGP